jgi:hypothetical protein
LDEGQSVALRCGSVPLLFRLLRDLDVQHASQLVQTVDQRTSFSYVTA